MGKSIALLFVTLVGHIAARAFPAPVHNVIFLQDLADSHVDLIHSDYAINGEHDESSHSRQRRASFDPYLDYENYDNYYKEEQPSHRPSHPSRPRRPDHHSRFDVPNSYDDRYNTIKRQEFDGAQGPLPPSPGTKYSYQPVFQYKSTNHHKHKLFVPNIFG